MKNTLTIDHKNRLIVMDRTFAMNALNTRSDEYEHLQKVRKHYPKYSVVQRHIRKNENKETYKGLTYVIDEMTGKPVLRSGGKRIASPFQLLTKDGDIYLLAYDDSSEKMATYRVSHMTNVSLTGEGQTDELIFKDMDLEAYYRNGFAVYAVAPQHVAIQFQNRHLDTVVERFGTEKSKYAMSGSNWLTVDVDTEIGPSLYNWLLTFGTEAKILKPERAAEAFLKHIDDIKNIYTVKP